MHSPTAAPDVRFAGFPRAAFELLSELAKNNNRAWFAEHRSELDDLLVRPALGLVVELGPLLRRQVSRDLRAEPRVGGSMLRLQHDARFSRAAPYRTHLELWFWEGAGPSHQHPGFMVRLTPAALVLGAGITTFPAWLLARYRAAVDEPASGRELAAVAHRLEQAGWTAHGAQLRGVPDPFAAEHERAGLLRRLGLRLERSEPLPEAVHGSDLAPIIVAGFARARPLHRWLRRLDT